ncbi:hypothetical protein CC85DRAFT_330088 [Cutaneotrichosporon oleaginosum]|uniref:N-acetyltransferase domain-containing protein n=1 Tax=Cutaneotrichosporon oleaginosum TaxID=879819 RepID=A0A0J1AY03_9TREE|nr:uncharacterized protein CC85DRAFT_330088 [Cutaneotrichosporon oleaginosum]KLT40209.1 hypothetical protein CC85DRAFT_330088 [Cutaneotrichosporon oleaginosum]TXT10501.1 hypothetical protein COLE_04435 [Cutaneotrichosporon oleaginosum]
MTSWALVPAADPCTTDLLSHCVTYRRRAVARTRHGDEEVVAYGVSAVYTPPALRGRGYARRSLQLLHYALAPREALPPFPDWGMPPHGPRDARLSFLHSGIDGAFYTACTQGLERAGWVLKPPHTRLLTVRGPAEAEYEMLGAKDVAELQDAYEMILRQRLRPGQVAVIPDLSALTRLAPPSVCGEHFGARVATGWFTYLKLRPSEDMPWRLTLSVVHGTVPFAVVASVAIRERASVIEYGGEGFTDWDEDGVEIDYEWPKPCVCVYGESLEWIAPETLVIEAVGVPGHWAWY